MRFKLTAIPFVRHPSPRVHVAPLSNIHVNELLVANDHLRPLSAIDHIQAVAVPLVIVRLNRNILRRGLAFLRWGAAMRTRPAGGLTARLGFLMFLRSTSMTLSLTVSWGVSTFAPVNHDVVNVLPGLSCDVAANRPADLEHIAGSFTARMRYTGAPEAVLPRFA